MDTHDVMRVRRPWSLGALYLVIAATVLTGCASLPNVAPFTDATVKLTSAARSAGDMTVEDVLRATDTVLPQNKETLKDKADELKDAWAKHVAALEAASDYARSLQSVVDAANQSRQSVQNVADAAKDLADKVGLAVPAAGTASAVAVGVATDAIKLAVTQINNARGRKTLTEAMEDLVPAIDQVASVFKASLGDLGKIVDASSQLQLNSLRTNIANELGYRNGLVQGRLTFYEKGWSKLTNEEKLRLKSLEEALAATDSWYKPYLQDYSAIATRREDFRMTVTAVQRGVKEWAATHERLRIALKQGNQIDTTALIDTVVEIRDLVKRAREL